MANKQTKAQKAYKRIRKLLIMGHLPHKKRMSLRPLAEQLKMSVVPVSEAVRKLEQERLLITQPQSGIYLRRLKPSEKRQMNLIRQALEVQAARLVATVQPKKELEILRKLAAKIKKQVQQNKPDLAANTDVEFHRKLVSATGSPMLLEQYEKIAVVSMVCSMVLPMRWSEEENPIHTNLVDALETGNPDKAARAVLNHIKAESIFLEGKLK